MLYKICQEKLSDSRVSIFTPEFNLFISVYILHNSPITNSKFKCCGKNNHLQKDICDTITSMEWLVYIMHEAFSGSFPDYTIFICKLKTDECFIFMKRF